MYTFFMRRSSNTTRWWDWTAIFLLFLILELTASRLIVTNWLDFLQLVQTATYIGFMVGVILGYSTFSLRTSRWLSFTYLILILPMQWTLLIDQNASLEEQVTSTLGRLLYAYSDFFARRPVEDAILFISLTSLGFWLLASSAGFQLVRNQKHITAIVPSAVTLLVIQNYDNLIEGRAWFIAFFAFLALLLLGRLKFLADRKSWHERRVFISPDNNIDLTSTMAIAAGLIILFAWIPPASISGFEAAEKMWVRATRPWREFAQRMDNALSALDGTTGSKAGEFYGPELLLGQGFDFSDTLMFTVQAPQIQSAFKPPRYYWRGRTYDYFDKGQWYTTGSSLVDYSPNEPIAVETESTFKPERFVFNLGGEALSLVYAPAQPIWFSRQGNTLNTPTDSKVEVITWYAYPYLSAGETYQVDVVLSNPDTRQLREAGINYPAWVTTKYLQLPEGFSPRIKELAVELTAEAETPYEKSVAITRYLRNNIEYVDTLPRAPRNEDPLEWMLFENQQAYCVYYASAEVLMLRSLGIPARLAVGFAQGEKDNYLYTVRRENAHAWPEVYFPQIGWIEFEPTGGQPSLNRPAPPEAQLPGAQNNRGIPDQLESDTDRIDRMEESVDANASTTPDTAPINPSLYLIPSAILFLTLTVYFSRRYALPARIPVALKNSIERSGMQAPQWIIHWEQWVNISPIERSFESINFGIRLLEQPMPIHATPGERAKKLGAILPQMTNEIDTLLDEHQTSLYTSRHANATIAKRAAIKIRWHAILEKVRYIMEGKPVDTA